MDKFGSYVEFRHGWKVLISSFFGIGVSMVSLMYYSSGIFIKPLQESFGWSRAQLGAANFLSIISVVIFAPLAGKLVDWLGLRLVATGSLAFYATCVFALSYMDGSLSVYYAIVIAYTIVGLGSSPIAFTRAINAWFSQNRGLALGISMTGTGVAGMIMPLLLTPYVAEHGWRSGYQILVIVILMAVPIVCLWASDNPGEPKTAGEALKNSQPNLAKLPGVSFAVARQDPVFWALGSFFFLIALGVSGLIISFIPLLLDAGLSPVAAGICGATLGASVVVGRIVTGFLVDRFFAPQVAAVLLAFVATGCLALAYGGIGMATVAAIALGIAMGAETDLIGYLVFRYFGIRAYSQIYGLQYSLFAVGGGISSLSVGAIYDIYGNYDFALILGAALLSIAAASSFFLPAFPERFSINEGSNAS